LLTLPFAGTEFGEYVNWVTVGNAGTYGPFYRADGSNFSTLFNTPAFGYLLIR
jgi:hypothetical protein